VGPRPERLAHRGRVPRVVERAIAEKHVGFDHLALNAESRAKVDECAKLLDELGGEIDDPPAVVSEYGEDYYAMWVRDPSGLRIEVVYQGS
jgi:catechol 2,3-dioxygenase-like lactoylglutathione lyase family enzyme